MNSMSATRPSSKFWLERVIKRYASLHPNEQGNLKPLNAAIATRKDLFDRLTMPLHVTASAIVVDCEHAYVLLLLHRRLGIWLQPGGHLEPGETPPQTAIRELFEECDVVAPVVPTDVPLEIDLHSIPAHPQKNEPEHNHADFRYLFILRKKDLVISDESYEARWFHLEDANRVSQGRLTPVLTKLKAKSFC